jgi:hypothetical protein
MVLEPATSTTISAPFPPVIRNTSAAQSERTVVDGVRSAQLTGDLQFVVRGAGRYDCGADGCDELEPVVSGDT